MVLILMSIGEDSISSVAPEIAEDGPMDVVVALPGQVTMLRMKFDKPGCFVWHCHILSHEVSCTSYNVPSMSVLAGF